MERCDILLVTVCCLGSSRLNKLSNKVNIPTLRCNKDIGLYEISVWAHHHSTWSSWFLTSESGFVSFACTKDIPVALTDSAVTDNAEGSAFWLMLTLGSFMKYRENMKAVTSRYYAYISHLDLLATDNRRHWISALITTISVAATINHTYYLTMMAGNIHMMAGNIHTASWLTPWLILEKGDQVTCFWKDKLLPCWDFWVGL